MGNIAATVKSVDPAGAGSWTAVASAPSIDRDREVVDAGAFEPLPAQVPVHDEHFGQLIGSARPYYVGDLLYVDGTFASTPRAQEMRTLVLEGHLTSMSIVFFDATTKDVAGITHITAGELLAVDWAPIPANRDSRLVAARSLGRTATRATGTGVGASAVARAMASLAEVDLAELEAKEARLAAEASDPRQVLADAERFLDITRQRHRR